MTLRAADVTVKPRWSGPIDAHLEPTAETPGGYRRESCYDVTVDGEFVGRVFRREFTRETRTRGKRYVNRRWSSMGWTYVVGERFGIGTFEADTRRDAVRMLLEDRDVR